MSGRVTVHVDLMTPRSGLALATGAHGFPESPQALLGREDPKDTWYVEDSYRDPNRTGGTRPDFHATADGPVEAVKVWLQHLEIDPEAADIQVHSEYDSTENEEI